MSEPVSGEGRVLPSRLPTGRAVVTTQVGPHEGREDAYQAMRQWLIRHGRTPAGARWEIYHTDPADEADCTRWRADVVVPYRTG